jgi:hypothetical protein
VALEFPDGFSWSPGLTSWISSARVSVGWVSNHPTFPMDLHDPRTDQLLNVAEILILPKSWSIWLSSPCFLHIPSNITKSIHIYICICIYIYMDLTNNGIFPYHKICPWISDLYLPSFNSSSLISLKYMYIYIYAYLSLIPYTTYLDFPKKNLPKFQAASQPLPTRHLLLFATGRGGRRAGPFLTGLVQWKLRLATGWLKWMDTI